MIICIAASLFFKAEVVDVSAEGLPTAKCTVTLRGNTLVVGDGNPCVMDQKFLGNASTTTLDKTRVQYIQIRENVYAPEDSSRMFYQFTNLKEMIDIENINTSYAVNVSNMFYGCTNLRWADVSSWDKSNITNAKYMFYDCKNLIVGDISNWDFTGKNTYDVIAYIFTSNSNMQVVNMNNFKVDGSVSNLIQNSMSSINRPFTINVYNWDLENIESLQYAFYGNPWISEINGINTWRNTSNIVTTRCMFYNLYRLKEINLGNLEFPSLLTINAMFGRCQALEIIDLSGWKMPILSNVNNAFYYCTSLKEIDISGMIGSNITDPAYMFGSCDKLRTIYVDKSWGEMKQSLSQVSMFSYDNYLTGGDGTRYQSGNDKALYAHIDEGINNPGYFTSADLKDPNKEGLYTVIYNEPYHGFKLLKTSSYDNGPVEGAQFRVWGMSDYGTEYYEIAESNSNGVVDFDGFEPGTYLMQEIQAPEHYLLDSTQRVVKIKKNGDVSIPGLVDTGVYYLVQNQRLEDDEIVIVKKWNDRKTGSEAVNREYPVVSISPDMPESYYTIFYDLNGKGYFGDTKSEVNMMIYDFSNGTPEIVGGQEIDIVPKSIEYDHVDQWYYDKELTKPYNPGDIPNQDTVTLYAGWVETAYMPYARNLQRSYLTNYGYITSKVKHIVRADSLPSDGTSYSQYDNYASRTTPIYYWYDTNTDTLYWYTTSYKVRTDTLDNLFRDCNNLEDEDFTLYLTNEGASTSNSEITSLNAAYEDAWN